VRKLPHGCSTAAAARHSVHCRSHLGYEWFGWQGVHVFILLSGFLLGSTSRAKGYNRNWTRWLARRGRRILPCYWAVLDRLLDPAALEPLEVNDASVHIWQSVVSLLRDLTLLRNVAYRGMFAYPTRSVVHTLITGLYLVFPCYSASWPTDHRATCSDCRNSAAFVEFVYRAVCIFCWTACPRGMDMDSAG